MGCDPRAHPLLQETTRTAGHGLGLYLQLTPRIPHLLSLCDSLLPTIFFFLKLT